MINEERLVKLFKDLCLIDAPALKEADSVAFVRKHLEGMGLEVSEDDLRFEDGAFRVQGAPDKVRTIPELAVSAWTASGMGDPLAYQRIPLSGEGGDGVGGGHEHVQTPGCFIFRRDIVL